MEAMFALSLDDVHAYIDGVEADGAADLFSKDSVRVSS
jgi:hypothetical protein